VRRILRSILGRVLPVGARPSGPSDRTLISSNVYEQLYEAWGTTHGDEEVVGEGDYDLIGRIELGVLLAEGLRPAHTLVDFGCGTGRLAVHAIPALAGGHYIGIDIAPSMLAKAERRVCQVVPRPPCRVSWIQQTTTVFPLADASVDVMCAFSVFTHVEHEDAYRYLKDAMRVITPGGRFIYSCLPLNLEYARRAFLSEASETIDRRWSRIRTVTTSIEMMDAIARLAGWVPLRWLAGDERNIQAAGCSEKYALAQSVCVLEHPTIKQPRS
jgi:SAM-dependent methyltransferase